MDLQWILLALFLVAIVWGVTKSFSVSMLRNTLRLGSVVVSFLITFGLQLGGVFQNAVATVLNMVNLASMLPGLESAAGLINGLASTLVSPILFVLVFLLILWVLRIVIYFVVRGIEKSQAKKMQNAECKMQNEEPAPVEEAPVEEATEEAPAEEATEEAPAEEVQSAECSAQSYECVVPAEEAPAEEAPAEETPAEEAPAEEEPAEEAPAEEATAEEATAEPVAAVEEAPAEPAPVAEPAPEKPGKAKKEKKKKKPVFYPECAWKRIVSIACGVVSGVLILSVLLMPTFYIMSVATSATDPIETSDADDSQVYQIVDVVNEYVVGPYSNSFVAGFYDAIGLSGLMNYTTRAGGKITLENGTVVYADDVLKGIITHGVSAAAQITSAKSECADIKGDVNAIISDPMVSSLLADVLMGVIADLEMEEPAEEDLMGGLINNFVDYYKNADKATIEKDIQALGGAVGVLAESRILAALISGNADLEDMLEDEEILGDVVEAISGLSAFGPTVEGAFELGIEILGETLQIPANDAEAYDIFMEELLTQMVKSDSTEFKSNTIKYYVYTIAQNGGRTSSLVSGHKMFTSYVAHWEKVQSAFAHASEDKTYGWFTIDINGITYIYDKTNKTIITVTDENREQYKDYISPVAGVVNALTLKSGTAKLTRDNLYTILNAYVSSTADAASLEVANRILAKDGFVSHAVTVEKMLAATNFTDWTDEEKAKDSRLCVDIIMDLLGLMDSLGNMDTSEGIEGALDLVDQFGTLGATMDVMKQTSCINQLPPLLIEGLVKNEMLSTYMKPSIAFQINNIVENNNKSYADCMNQIAVNIRWAITTFGGEQ